MNVNFKAYLNKLRIQYACELIDDGHTCVSEISAMCGFSDSLYFSKTFKKHMGYSPTEYVKKQEVRAD
jgi:two-component system response regulator YesN